VKLKCHSIGSAYFFFLLFLLPFSSIAKYLVFSFLASKSAMQARCDSLSSSCVSMSSWNSHYSTRGWYSAKPLILFATLIVCSFLNSYSIILPPIILLILCTRVELGSLPLNLII